MFSWVLLVYCIIKLLPSPVRKSATLSIDDFYLTAEGQVNFRDFLAFACLKSSFFSCWRKFSWILGQSTRSQSRKCASRGSNQHVFLNNCQTKQVNEMFLIIRKPNSLVSVLFYLFLFLFISSFEEMLGVMIFHSQLKHCLLQANWREKVRVMINMARGWSTINSKKILNL